MRRVRFGIADRLVLTPIEMKGAVMPTLIIAVLVYFTGGSFMSLAVISGMLTGTFLFPLLLPYLPTKDFSTKGFVLGGIFAFILIYLSRLWVEDMALWLKIGQSLSHLLIWPALVGFFALNFTGSTPFASRTGVKKEIKRYARLMAVSFALGVILNLALGFLK